MAIGGPGAIAEMWPKIAKAVGLDPKAHVRRVIIDLKAGDMVKVFVEMFASDEVFEEDTLAVLLSGSEIFTNEDASVQEVADAQAPEKAECHYCGRRIGASPFEYVVGTEGSEVGSGLVAHAMCAEAARKQGAGRFAVASCPKCGADTVDIRGEPGEERRYACRNGHEWPVGEEQG